MSANTLPMEQTPPTPHATTSPGASNSSATLLPFPSATAPNAGPPASTEHSHPAPKSTPQTPAQTTPNKLKRIRFNSEWDALLLKSVVANNAHIAEHGQSQKKFEETVATFIASAPPSKMNTVIRPSWKTVYDRFKKLVADHRSEDRTNAGASGIDEEESETSALLYDIVQAMDDTAEARRAERNEKTDADRRLQEAGEIIREQALTRVARPTRTVTEDEESVKKKRKASDSYGSDDEQSALIKSHIDAQSKADEKRCKIETERLQLERSGFEQQKLFQDREHILKMRRMELEERRLALDEKRVALDAEERRSQIEERSKTLEVLGSLVKKLS